MASKSSRISPVLAWANDGSARDAAAAPWGERGAFTTMRVRVANKAYAWSVSRHCERLFSDLSEQGMESSENADTLKRRLGEWLSKQPDGDYLCRVSLTDTGGACALRPWQRVAASLEGVPYEYTRTKPRLKATGWYQTVVELIGQVTLSAQEPLLVSADGRLLEGATCNLVVVCDGQLLTPASDCLPGISLQLLRESEEIRHEEISVEQAQRADEILCVGSGRQLVALKSVPKWGWQAKSDCTYSRLSRVFEEALATELSCLS